TLRAVALGRVIEQVEAALLARTQLHLPAKKRVVLARVGIEVGGTLLKYLEREEQILPRRGGVVEHARAKRRGECPSRRRRTQPAEYRRAAAVGHLEWREQRQRGLLARRRHATVPGTAASRPLVVGVVVVVLPIMFGERRRVLRILERRHGANAGRGAERSAQLHRARVGRPVVMRRIVTRRTCRSP